MPERKIDTRLLAFGCEVKRLRQEAGLSQTHLAELVNVTRSYIGQVESGRTKCRQDFAARLDKALNAGAALEEAWAEHLAETKYPQFFLSFPRHEATAAMLRAYEQSVVYGLLQTEAYARVLLLNDEDVESRMKRQKVLSRERPPMLCVVMAEVVLHTQVGTPKVMREQLEFLFEVSFRERVYLQIAPTAYYRGVWGSFTIATQADRSEVAYSLSAFGGETSNAINHVTLASEAFATLQAKALNVTDTRALIRKEIEERWT